MYRFFFCIAFLSPFSLDSLGNNFSPEHGVPSISVGLGYFVHLLFTMPLMIFNNKFCFCLCILCERLCITPTLCQCFLIFTVAFPTFVLFFDVHVRVPLPVSGHDTDLVTWSALFLKFPVHPSLDVCCCSEADKVPRLKTKCSFLVISLYPSSAPRIA